MEPSDADIAERLSRILASEEFQPEASDRLLRWLSELDAKFGAWLSSLHGLGSVLALALGTLAVALLVWALQAWLVSPEVARRPSADGSAEPELDASPASLLARARALADAGSLREAARALQAAVLRAACDQRELEWRPALSDGEWLSVLGPSEALVALTRATERIAFGPEPTRAAFEACDREARGLLARGMHRGGA